MLVVNYGGRATERKRTPNLGCATPGRCWRIQSFGLVSRTPYHYFQILSCLVVLPLKTSRATADGNGFLFLARFAIGFMTNQRPLNRTLKKKALKQNVAKSQFD